MIARLPNHVKYIYTAPVILQVPFILSREKSFAHYSDVECTGVKCNTTERSPSSLYNEGLINLEALEKILADYLNENRVTTELKSILIKDIYSQIMLTAFDIIRDYSSDVNIGVKYVNKRIMEDVLQTLMFDSEELYP